MPRKSGIKPLAAAISLMLCAGLPWPTPAGAQQAEKWLREIEVRGAPEGEYLVKDAPGVLRTDAPLRDVPASVKVVPRAVIDEQQALRLDRGRERVRRHLHRRRRRDEFHEPGLRHYHAA